MIGCFDVDYRGDEANAACVMFATWGASIADGECVARVSDVEPYVPGQFYRRELPCLLAALKKSEGEFSVVVIDGYVWLDAGGAPGLGAHLFDALEKKVPVIGVAKTRFEGAAPVEITRGSSRQPLFITAAGIDLALAASQIQVMHGPHRIPTLLKRADQLCRAW